MKNVCEPFNTSGNLSKYYGYAPFGAVSSSSGTNQPFQWSSEHYDSELDLVYYNYRHYSPSLGRFLSRDPIQEQGGLNLYAFVGNSVSKFVDTRGHKASVIGICSDRVPIVGSHGIANAAEFEVLGEALRQLYMKKVDDFLLEKGQFESAHDFKERVSEEFQKNYISDFSAEIRRLKSATEKAKSALEDCLK